MTKKNLLFVLTENYINPFDTVENRAKTRLIFGIYPTQELREFPFESTLGNGGESWSYKGQIIGAADIHLSRVHLTTEDMGVFADYVARRFSGKLESRIRNYMRVLINDTSKKNGIMDYVARLSAGIPSEENVVVPRKDNIISFYKVFRENRGEIQ